MIACRKVVRGLAGYGIGLLIALVVVAMVTFGNGLWTILEATAETKVRIEKKARSSEAVQAEIDAITGEFEYLKNLRFQLSRRLSALQDREKVLQGERRRAMNRELAADKKPPEEKPKRKGKKKKG